MLIQRESRLTEQRILLQDTFPWDRLPKELQVKVLEHLHRRDLSRCRTLNREMFATIKANERSMRKRSLELVRIERIGQGRVQLSMRCQEEGKSMKWVACQKRRRRYPLELSNDTKKTLIHLYQNAPAASLDAASLLTDEQHEYISSSEVPPIIIERLAEIAKGSEIDRLRINEMELSDTTLSSISTCLRQSSCRVRLLTFELSSLESVSPSALFRFVSDVAPADIVLRMLRGCRAEHFEMAMCRFITSRRFFSVSELVDIEGNDVSMRIDSILLAELKATTFQISTPNFINAEGLQQFLKAVASGTRQVVAARIQTNFPLDGLCIPAALSHKLLIRDKCTLDICSSIDFNSLPVDSLSTSVI
ncbi:unnamed protein product [Angiostrongylus costaricensis]|uniref:F-box domain-containing protein n=1 Tax=Angiostrongylus costaricensis TaxID=334426 RepID=A0A158PKM9_ANGCS|nr:unnamed protein product [Angiostrongylus costaricensis]